jgi:hypothetical protein
MKEIELIADEYKELVYQPKDNLKNKITPIRNNSNHFEDKINKKSSENDFKVKYKTEICRFWEFNQNCKFGEKVL